MLASENKLVKLFMVCRGALKIHVGTTRVLAMALSPTNKTVSFGVESSGKRGI